MRRVPLNETEIRCRICGGSGKHPLGVDTPCGACSADGFSTMSEDMPRNGTTVSVFCSIPRANSEELLDAAKKQFPELIDVHIHSENPKRRADWNSANELVFSYTLLISWVNKDYAERLELDKQGKLYPQPYFDK